MDSTKNVVPVEVVGLDMGEERQGAFDQAVDKAWKVLGHLDAFVNCYAYEGIYTWICCKHYFGFDLLMFFQLKVEVTNFFLAFWFQRKCSNFGSGSREIVQILVLH